MAMCVTRVMKEVLGLKVEIHCTKSSDRQCKVVRTSTSYSSFFYL